MKVKHLYCFFIFCLITFNSLWATESGSEKETDFPQQIIEVQAQGKRELKKLIITVLCYLIAILRLL
jgi:hypothetical protein